MKTLTKEDLPIGTKVVPHGKTRGMSFEECDSWNTNEARKQGFLYVARNDECGYLALNELSNEKTGSHYNYSDVTLYEEKPKIKKKELQNRIEVLEKKVAELDVIGKGIIEAEADKPQFEVGKVYKGNCIFYCTKGGDCETLEAFGFNYKGYWEESINLVGSDFSDFTEATPEEWLKRLEEEAKKRGFMKGVRFNSPNATYDFSFNQQIIEENFEWDSKKMSLKCKTDKNYGGGNVMRNGKWAEIKEPQTMTVKERDELAKPFNPDEYKIGTIGLFWDGAFDEQISIGNVLFGELDHITENGHFRRKGESWSYYNFKPIKID